VIPGSFPTTGQLVESKSCARIVFGAGMRFNPCHMTSLLIATRNTHKVGEIRFILGDGFKFFTLADFVGSPQVVEDAATFQGNARKKAEEIARWLALTPPATRHASPAFVLADDSGLEVDALEGAPGVHSARFAALDSASPGNSKDDENNAKLLRLLADVPGPQRRARFRCVIAVTRVPPPQVESASPVCYAGEFAFETELFEGACEGLIGFEPHGRGGFGYDPLFFPLGSEKSFAQLPREKKNEISHRAQALKKLKKFFKTPPAK
jgi:XTP/dITP diphosphohydrolase